MSNECLSGCSKIIQGAVIFADIDDYLARVTHVDAAEEWQFAKPLYRAVEEASQHHGIQLVRTFGDAFLLYAEGLPDPKLLEQVSSFLDELRVRFEKHQVSFK